MAHSSRKVRNALLLLAAVLSLAVVAAFTFSPAQPSPGGNRQSRPAPVSVEVATRGPIEHRRIFSGSLQAAFRLNIAPKISGQLSTIAVDLADPVTNGQVVATLDRAEAEQLVAQAEADLAVASASRTEAQSAAEIARREHDRVAELHEQRIVSDSEYDASRATYLGSIAAEEVALARVRRAEAALESARIRLSYTSIRAEWTRGDDQRVVAERLAEEGDAVSAAEPILTVVELDPIEAVFFAAETEYASLAEGQPVEIVTDAFPGRVWTGAIARVAPIFRVGSRQARIEVEIPNPGAELKPGMFARIQAVLARVDDAVTIPRDALTKRQGRDVVFIANPDDTVTLRPVDLGIQTPGRVQIFGLDAGQRVVTLGQQLLEDGSAITIPDDLPDAEDRDAP